MSVSEIKEFFRDQTVFLTGGTGFLGKVLQEKLLRDCNDLKTIYVLVRDKNGKSAEERFDDIFSGVLYETLKSQQPGFRDKVRIIKGDCGEPGLGLSDDDRDLLKREVNVVLHAAANVRFDQTLKNAAYDNVRSIMAIIVLAKEMNNLKAFVHVSTAYSNCHQPHLKEQFYEPPIQAEKLLYLVETLDDESLERITPSFVGKWQNTYIFTKSIGEDVVRREAGNLPICVFRPAIVTATIKEPIAGWLNSLNGFEGGLVGMSVGVLRTLNLNLESKLAIIPCDYASNLVLAAAWYTHKNREEDGQKEKSVKIYNYAGSNRNHFLWGTFVKLVPKFRWELATNWMIWYPYGVFVRSRLLFQILSFFLHSIPCYLVDIVLTIIQRPPIAVKAYRKIWDLLESTEHFRMTSFHFDQENIEEIWRKMNETDRKLFNYNMDQVNFAEYIKRGFWFARQHLLKDSLESLPRARVKLVIFFFLHYGLFLLVLFWFVKFFLFIIG